jgi:hypothetical protein
MREHIAKQWTDRGIVGVGCHHAFAQIVQHQCARHSSKPAESFLMQFGPDALARSEHQQSNAFAAVAEREHEQPCAPVLARVRVAHHRTAAVVNLRFARRRNDDGAGVLLR